RPAHGIRHGSHGAPELARRARREPADPRDLSGRRGFAFPALARQRSHFAHAHTPLLRDALAPAAAAGPQGGAGMTTARSPRAATGTPTPHWSQLAESTCVWGIWLLYAIHRVFGRLLFRVVLYPVVLYYWATNQRARHASLDFLRRVHTHTGAAGQPPGL